MPGLTIATATGGTTRPGASSSNPAGPAASSTSTTNPHDDGAASPTRPPVSPITPTRTTAAAAHLAPTVTGSGTHYIANFAAERPNLVGDGAGASSDANATARPPRRPEPLDFDANPDVLALQSTIAILQIQRRKALADMHTLKAARDAALADPSAFVADLGAGRVRGEADPLFGGGGGGGGSGGGDDSDSSCSSGEEGEGASAAATASKKPPPWSSLPQPQNVVRMPPVNFDKYGVVGDVLDKLHHEQLTRPPQGAPTVIAADGTYKLKGGAAAAAAAAPPPDSQPYIGVATPYNPLKDKLDKKPKGAKR